MLLPGRQVAAMNVRRDDISEGVDVAFHFLEELVVQRTSLEDLDLEPDGGAGPTINVFDLNSALIDDHVTVTVRERTAISLWITHTYLFRRFRITSRLAILSPVEGSRKGYLREQFEKAWGGLLSGSRHNGTIQQSQILGPAQRRHIAGTTLGLSIKGFLGPHRRASATDSPHQRDHRRRRPLPQRYGGHPRSGGQDRRAWPATPDRHSAGRHVDCPFVTA